MLCYYFNKKLKENNKILFNEFLEYFKKDLKLTENNDDFQEFKEVEREVQIPREDKGKNVNKKEIVGQMDLVAENEAKKEVVIIENKIKSGINGKNNKNDNDSNQLKKYYRYYEDKKYKIKGLLFVPDYNEKKLKLEIEDLTEKINQDEKK